MHKVSVSPRVTVPIAAIGMALAIVCAPAEQAVARQDSTIALAQATTAAKARDPNLQEISKYKLTMDAVRKFAEASRGLKRVEETHPELEEDDDESDPESIDDMTARLDEIPAAANAVKAAGLGTREYVVIMFTLLQASFGHMAVEAGASPEKVAAEAGIHPANLAFIKQHKVEIEALNSTDGD